MRVWFIVLASLFVASAVFGDDHDQGDRAPASARPEEAGSAESTALIRELKTSLDELHGVTTGYRSLDESTPATGEGKQPSTFWSIPQ